MRIKNILFFGFMLVMFFVIISLVNAVGCCLETNSGEYCTTINENCKSGMYVSDECEQEELCVNKGACIEDNDCQDGVSEIKCGSGEFLIDKKCNEVEGYRDVCCVLSIGGSGGYMFMKQNKCESLDGDIEESVSNWIDCADLNKDPNLRLGCCVESGECTYGLVENCNGNFQGYYCSKLETQCDPICNSKSYKAPGKFGDQANDLYWFDSCDNQESLAEDCDDLKETPEKNDNGDLICGDSTCKVEDLWDNPYTDENFDGGFNNDANSNTKFNGRNFRVNGESWCEYQQQKIGPGLDLPGTKHYVHSCISGEERVDPGSSDGRDEICIESKVTTPIGDVSSAKWIQNIPEECVRCNREDDVGGCCSSKYAEGIGCSYVNRKDVTNDGNIDLFFDSGSYSVIRDDILDGVIEINWQPDFHIEKAILKYYRDGELLHQSGNIRSGDVLILDNNNNKACSYNGCRITLSDLPEPGTYDVKLIISGYYDWGWFGTDEADYTSHLGTFTINPPMSVCVPLVPPSSNEKCGKSFSVANPLLNESQIRSFYDFNYYYNFPYNTFGLNSDCGDTEECRQEFINNFDSNASSVLLAYDMNKLCRSLGDCGASSNIAGNITTAGYVSTNVCTIIGGCYKENNISKTFFSALSNEYAKLNNDNGARPENFVPILFLIPFTMRRKFRGKFLFYILLLTILFLIACVGAYPGLGSLNGDRATIECNEWQKPVGGDDCWRCSATEDIVNDGKHGLLPKNNILQVDGKPAYKCTEYMCESLGAICKYASGLDEGEPTCAADVPDYTIPKLILLDVTYTCNTFEASDCEIGNYKIEDNSNSLFIKGKLEPLTQIEINFKTVDTNNQNKEIITTCKFSNNVNMEDPASLPYPDGGGESSTHKFRINNQVPKDENYKYYIRCTTQHGKSSVAPYAIVEFNVGREGYIKPFIESVSPIEAYAKYGSNVKDVDLFVRGDVVGCRWDNKKGGYNEMGTRTGSDKVTDVPEGYINSEEEGETWNVDSITISNVDWDRNFICSDASEGFSDSHICSAQLQGIQEGQNRFWFSCLGEDGTATDPWPENDEGFLVTGTTLLNITNIKCIHSLGEECGTIYDSKFDFSIETTGGAKDGEAGCEWGVGEHDFDVFDEPGGIFEPEFGKIHIERDFTHEGGEIILNFRCKDIADNAAEKSTSINIQKDTTSPKLTKVYRSGSELNVFTNEVTTCYYITDKSGTFEDAAELDTSDELEHSLDIEYQNNFYRVRCVDKFNNFKQTDIYIGKM